MDINSKSRIFLKGLAICIVSSAGLISAEASTLTTTLDFDFASTEITKTTPTHAIFLKCRLGENRISQSKGAILDLPKGLSESKKDFALVTGHGLHPKADCYISDFQGNSRKVLTKTFAKDYQSGTPTDWALISFKRIKGPHIKRYNLENYLENPSTLNDTAISFARARGLPQNDQNCKIAVIALKTRKVSQPVFSHNCRAIPGQSGSPLTQEFEGDNHLIGLHLGNVWTLKSPLTGKPGRLNILKPYDKQMADEVRQTLNQMK